MRHNRRNITNVIFIYPELANLDHSVKVNFSKAFSSSDDVSHYNMTL